VRQGGSGNSDHVKHLTALQPLTWADRRLSGFAPDAPVSMQPVCATAERRDGRSRDR
jgi:hypothetical protein